MGSSPICSSRLKTEPFYAWLEENVPDKDCIIYYGFDSTERNRIDRRTKVLSKDGYKSDYPLALWYEEDLVYYNPVQIDMFSEISILNAKYEGKRKYKTSDQIGIRKPLTYSHYKHGNCEGCLKAGQQHWYVVYVKRPDIWQRAKLAEKNIGNSIMNGVYLKDLEPKFHAMQLLGIPASEHIDKHVFYAEIKRKLKIDVNLLDFELFEPSEEELMTCGIECVG